MSELEALVAETITAQGPIPFSEFMELALYHQELGFYASVGRAGGRQGDFITSVETGPLFAALLGEWLDQRWAELGSPDPFLVAEGGAGVGTLWRGIRKASPKCFGALHWHLVERSDQLRQLHHELPAGSWSSSSQLPSERVHVVVANELLDNLVFDIAVKGNGGWTQTGVHFDPAHGFALVELDVNSVTSFDALAPDAPVGTRLPEPFAARAWIERATSIADHVLAFDYGAPVTELVERDGHWLRTYRNHERGHDPFATIGQCDITCDISPELLPAAIRVSKQNDWLHDNGLPALVEAAREVWRERGHIGDLEAMFARSAMNEAEALVDGDGLGGFLVLEW